MDKGIERKHVPDQATDPISVEAARRLLMGLRESAMDSGFPHELCGPGWYGRLDPADIAVVAEQVIRLQRLIEAWQDFVADEVAVRG